MRPSGGLCHTPRTLRPRLVDYWEMSMYLRRRHVRDFLIGGLATYGATWIVIEPISVFFESLKPAGFAGYSLLLAFAIIGGLFRVWPRKQVEFQIPASNSSFAIRFGDICEGGSGCRYSCQRVL